jgi:hypothetical protein
MQINVMTDEDELFRIGYAATRLSKPQATIQA